MFYRLRVALALAFLIVGTLSLASTSQLEARDRIRMTTLTSAVYLPLIARSTYSDTFPESQASILGTCSPEVHDRYRTTGPDGLTYRTWHPVTVPVDANNPNGPKCSFAHEHGDPPHPNGPKPPFGYVSYVNGSLGMIAAHAGYKVMTHYSDGRNGFGRPELDYGPGLALDFTVVYHQGTGGRNRLHVRFHDFWFWSRYQGQDTLITAMADTGDSVSKGGCHGATGPNGDRVVVDNCDHTYEQWIYDVNVGNAWNSGLANMAVTNPMNHISQGNLANCTATGCPDSVQLASTSETICGVNFTPCSLKLPFGQHGGSGQNMWLGHFRTIHEPDWTWTNAGKSTTFCTNPLGTRQACGLPNSVQQRVAAVNISNGGARILDRTPNSAGWNSYMNLPAGALGGN